MSLDPKDSTGSNFITRTLPKEGKNIMRNYGMVDLGTQMVSFQNQEPKPTPMVALLFEFPKVLQSIKEGEAPTPFTIAQDYSFIASERSKLCKVLKSWGQLKSTPKTLNLKPYLGQYCEGNIVHASKKNDPETIYANINDGGRDISPLTKEIENPSDPSKMITFVEADGKTPIGCKPHNQNIWFDLSNFNWEQFKTLPKYIQDKIKRSNEWPAIQAQHPEPQSAGATHQQNSAQSANIMPTAAAPVVSNDAPAF